MDKEKLTETLSDKAFLKKIFRLQTPEEVQAAFKENGVKISVEDVQLLGSVINEMVAKGTPQLSEEDLANISGGADTTSIQEKFSSLFAGISSMMSSNESIVPALKWALQEFPSIINPV